MREPGLEQVGALVLVPGEEVAVAVEGDRDRGVAHVGAECFGVDASGDHVGGVAVPAFVQPDPGEPGFLPGWLAVQRGGAGVERSCAARVGEDELLPALGDRRQLRLMPLLRSDLFG